ncbi:hypothetical protein SAMD00019534_111980 [Acytostelium subglobosum LB1]|uniref:hypothetical protein n=1 Tax=Acytostelium subglobosum LB1 TaxID=1410327 RepID=UPI000644EE5F|nr:hypothetical protein SAMD00019534_111980 [Acytostelium subglobosum LB1]GAM28022.1 hypothetical protein SAMD00019534_111980 [Acytostelium subglobosum LB1]|eukprot:XP_012748981.1 hypothetical protein SAMD00019534_111980 [Acytostelium subglobosum LB1]
MDDKVVEENNVEWPLLTQQTMTEQAEQQRLEMIRNNLLEDLRISLQHIIYTLIREGDNPQSTTTLYSDSFGVDRLCVSIEKILSHDLLASYNLWRVIQLCQTCAAQPTIAPLDFEDIRLNAQLSDARGKPRAYIRRLLNANSLSVFFERLTAVPSCIKCYGGESIVLVAHSATHVQSIFNKIDGIKFNLSTSEGLLGSTMLEYLTDHTHLATNDELTMILNRHGDGDEDVIPTSRTVMDSKTLVDKIRKLEGKSDEELISQYDNQYEDIEDVQSLMRRQGDLHMAEDQPSTFNDYIVNEKKKQQLIQSVTSNTITFEQAFAELSTISPSTTSTTSITSTTSTTPPYQVVENDPGQNYKEETNCSSSKQDPITFKPKTKVSKPKAKPKKVLERTINFD